MITLAFSYLISRVDRCGYRPTYKSEWADNRDPDSCAGGSYAHTGHYLAQHDLANECAYGCAANAANANHAYNPGSFASHFCRIYRSL